MGLHDRNTDNSKNVDNSRAPNNIRNADNSRNTSTYTKSFKSDKKAIALKYDKEKGTAPVITAVGKGVVADKIIEAADQSGVTRVEDEFQANALSMLDAGSKVPKFLYDLVAEVLLFVEEVDIKNQNGGAVH
ncbi:MAG: EscU/YscU/HrcU family type III secretion system export apparatus switch protein [Oscillospiraceae bacterium]|nr:EscU/YscU/HrcU family type III secretion system export apparatus switch protein [Oscillospiraceae bacterium]